MPREIQLTRGKVTIVDDDDYERVVSHKWFACLARQKRENWYAKRIEKDIDGSTINIYLHRFIMNSSKGCEVDHADGNGLNNTRANLRVCSRSSNVANAQRPRPKSGYRGVYFVPDTKRWKAEVSVNGRATFVGSHTDPAEAARIRDAAAYRTYGDFAILNFPRAVR